MHTEHIKIPCHLFQVHIEDSCQTLKVFKVCIYAKYYFYLPLCQITFLSVFPSCYVVVNQSSVSSFKLSFFHNAGRALSAWKLYRSLWRRLFQHGWMACSQYSSNLFWQSPIPTGLPTGKRPIRVIIMPTKGLANNIVHFLHISHVVQSHCFLSFQTVKTEHLRFLILPQNSEWKAGTPLSDVIKECIKWQIICVDPEHLCDREWREITESLTFWSKWANSTDLDLRDSRYIKPPKLIKRLTIGCGCHLFTIRTPPLHEAAIGSVIYQETGVQASYVFLT